MAYKYSFQLYSAREFPPLSAQFPKLKQMGYDGVEPFMPSFDGGVNEFRTMIDDAGLACYGFHANYADMCANPNKYFDIAQTIGATLIIAPWLEPEKRGQSAADWSAIGAALAKPATLAKAEGLEIAWHNHDFEFITLPDGSLPLTHLLDAGGDDLSFEADFAWVARAGKDPLDVLAEFGDRISAVQIKDTAPLGTTEEDGWTAPGKGILDWDAIAPEIAKTRSDHLVVEHDNPSDWEALASDAISFARKQFG